MATFSKKSKEKLLTCDTRIQRVLEMAIQYADFTVLCGARTPKEQFELFKQGRVLKEGVWVKVGSTVTNLDGVTKKSMHNYTPSKAVDIAPYPIDWEDLERFKSLAVVIQRCADACGVELSWGGSWKTFKDFPHWEIKD